VRVELRYSSRLTLTLAVFLLFAAFTAHAQLPEAILPGPKPLDVPAEWKKWIGEYGSSFNPITYVLSEKDEFIWISERPNDERDAHYKALEKFSLHSPLPTDPAHGMRLQVDQNGTRLLLMGDVGNGKRTPEGNSSQSARIKPGRPIRELREEALAASPPRETGSFRKPELIELAPLDPGIHLDVRYATSNDFLGTPVYTQARAFLARPAAEALLRVQKKLQPLGYGLLIHDAYRPWYVTKIFWDATPPEGKIFVADPAQGSRHNRGCAVDLTLYDLATGQPIEMPGTYDEMSPRSFPDYPGGTSLQRWHRDLLRRAMESEGFSVYEAEWWHFDYQDWHDYPILNVPFERVDSGKSAN
jgi:D-alanyl-D-alanine dipeptidase